VALFVFDGYFGSYSRMELLDQHDEPTRTGPLSHPP